MAVNRMQYAHLPLYAPKSELSFLFCTLLRLQTPIPSKFTRTRAILPTKYGIIEIFIFVQVDLLLLFFTLVAIDAVVLAFVLSRC